MTLFILVVFVAIWVVTFIPAWKLLFKLLALSVTDKPGSTKFIFNFLLYRLLILLPYIWLFLFGHKLPPLLKGLIISFLAFGLFFSAVRFFFKRQATAYLWQIYSNVYDSLLKFYPYKNLLALVYRRLELKPAESVLDAGCGTGNLSKLILSHHSKASITAVDVSSSMLRRARKKLAGHTNVEIIQSDINGFLKAHPEKKFDVIALVNVLYAVDDTAQLWKLCLESRRNLKKI
jgi:hypothetical protein